MEFERDHTTGRSRNHGYFYVALMAATFGLVYATFKFNPVGSYERVQETQFYLRTLYDVGWSFWNELIAFGVPEPLQQNYIWHPMFHISHFLYGHSDIALIVAAQAAVGVMFMFLVCRELGVGVGLSSLMTLSYVMSEVTTRYLVTGWEATISQTQVWLMIPVFTFAFVRYLHVERRRDRLLWITLFALCISFAYVNGHVGQFWTVTWTFGAFGLMCCIREPRHFGYFVYAGILIVLMSLWKNAYLLEHRSYFDIGLDREAYQPMTFGYYLDMVWGMFFRPVFPPSIQMLMTTLQNGDLWESIEGIFEEYYFYNKNRRWLFFGPPFAVIGVIALFSRRSHHPLHRPLAVALAVSMLWLCLPLEASFKILAVPQMWSEPVTFFGILLAGVTLQAMARRKDPGRSRLITIVVSLQLAFLLLGMAPRYIEFIRNPLAEKIFADRAGFKFGRLETEIRRVVKRKPIRVYFAEQAYRAMELFRVRHLEYRFGLISRDVLPVSMDKFYPDMAYMHGEIKGDANTASDSAVLDVVGATVVVAKKGERVDDSLFLAGEVLWQQDIQFEIYLNRDAWSWATIVDNGAREIALARRVGCPNDRLMCADFTPLLKLARPNQVVSSQWHGDTLVIALDPAPVPRTLFVSQAYWPGWKASTDGQKTAVFPLVEAFTGIAVPSGASDIRLSYDPPRDQIAMIVTMSTFGGSLLLIVVLFAMNRIPRFRRRRDATSQ